MREILLTFLIVASIASVSCVSTHQSSNPSGTKAPSWSQAVYCNIEDLDVCAVTQSDDDCKKLGGKKISACYVSGN